MNKYFFNLVHKAALVLLWMVAMYSGYAGPVEDFNERELNELQQVKQRVLNFMSGGGAERGWPNEEAVRLADNRRSEILERDFEPISLETSADKTGELLRGRLSELRILATGYRSPASEYFRSDQVLDRIIESVENVLDHFNPDSPRVGNWHTWLIIIPANLGAVGLLMEGDLPDVLYQRMLRSLAYELDGLNLDGANAASEARNHMYLALMEGNTERLANAAIHAFKTLKYSTDFGVREDHSYLFHGRIPYAGGYGAGFAWNTAQFLYFFDGTRWSTTAEKRELLANFLLEHAQWFIVGDFRDMHIAGRSYASRGGVSNLLGAMLLMTQVDNSRKDDLVAAVASLIKKGATVPGDLADIASKVVLSLAKEPTGFRYWDTAEMGVYKGNGYHVGFRQFSRRVQDYEYLTLEGGEGWDLAYGFTNILRRGDEWYSGRQLHRGIDMTLLPGTTNREGAHPENPKTTIDDTGYSLNFGTSPYSGGTGWSGGGVAGFILKPVFGEFIARKSLHFFPEGFWALGSGITSTQEEATETKAIRSTILQWIPDDEDERILVSGGREFTQSMEVQKLKSVQWFWIDRIGCVFERPTDLLLKWENEVLTLWIDHGHDPKDAVYAYAVLPVASKEETRQFARNRLIWPARYDNAVHSVVNRNMSANSVVFFEAGDWSDFTVDHPAIVYRESGPDRSVLLVQNPLQNSAPIEISCIAPEDLFLDDGVIELPAGKLKGEYRSFRVDTFLGKTYRIGHGHEDGAVALVRREDIAVFHAFKVEASHDAEKTLLDVTLPDEVMDMEYKISLRGNKGHLIREFTDDEVVARPSANVVRYLWQRAIPESDGVVTTKLRQSQLSGDFRIYLDTPRVFAVSYFTIPAFDAKGKIITDAQLPLDRNKPPELPEY